ncbi:hypothetical protein [Shimazuella alba]|jgi:hypothetical protein|uniref:Uncharacterized protein n=1 Tax=Shimazuella alba TaxID=2690964 RepID=A0A6I4VX75_9BACL|nr:hypothetical protein [Shimazuella alba]MXQ54530.1 hypothetical protein [Shimazuella alba]
MTWKERRYGKKEKRAALRKLIFEGLSLERDIGFAKAKEKRKAARAMRREAKG